MKVKSANGISGCLIHLFDGNYALRVYDEQDGTFIDYNLLHSDLLITINDEDACLYTHDDGNTYLDHSPETLGITIE